MDVNTSILNSTYITNSLILHKSEYSTQWCHNWETKDKVILKDGSNLEDEIQ